MSSQASRHDTATLSGFIQKFREKIANGRPIIGAAAHDPGFAQWLEAAKIDYIVVNNAVPHPFIRSQALVQLLPFGNANALVKTRAPQVLSAVKQTPVLAGICSTDPWILLEHLIRELIDLGFAGVQNTPSVGLIDGEFRANLESTGMGYDLEIESIRLAHQQQLLTAANVFNPKEARLMMQARPDLVVANMGLALSEMDGANAEKLQDRARQISEIANICKTGREEVLVLCDLGSGLTADQARYLLDECKSVDGFQIHLSRDKHTSADSVANAIRSYSPDRQATN